MKMIRYILAGLIIITVGYHSVFFRKLDDYKASQSAKAFDAAQYAHAFWYSKLIPNLGKALELTQLMNMLSENPANTFDNYSHALGIGNLRYFLVRGNGIIDSVRDNDVTVLIQNGKNRQRIMLATEYIFGNAVRDASDLININEFSNTMDFNNVSAEINKIIRETVLPPFKRVAKKGNGIRFTGAIELNREHLDIINIELIPIQIQVDP